MNRTTSDTPSAARRPRRRPLGLRIVAGAVALGIILALLALAHLFLGDPVSARFASWRAERDLAARESGSLYRSEGPGRLDFKRNGYVVVLRNPDTKDDWREVVWSIARGTVEDGMAPEARKQMNAARRLEREGAEAIEPTLRAQFPDMVEPHLSFRDDAVAVPEAPWQKELSAHMGFILRLRQSQPTLEGALEALRRARTTLEEAATLRHLVDRHRYR